MILKKCSVCLLGTWTVGLSAVAWGLFAVFGGDLVWPTWAKGIAGVVALTGLGFLFYQPPMKPCPRCVAATVAANQPGPPG